MAKRKEVFVKGNTPSSKNGRQWTGKYSVASKSTQKYYKESKQDWIDLKEGFLKLIEGKAKPYKIQLEFVRNSRRRFDYLNPAQTIFDQMVNYGWLDDDNVDEIVPVFAPYRYDKENPGCTIKVL